MSVALPEWKTLEKVVRRLDEATIPYMLTGSFALSFYGHVRATNDIDIIVQMNRMEGSDTSPEAQEEYDRRMRALTREERFFKTMALVCISRRMAVAGIRARFPHLNGEALKHRIILEMYPGS